MAALTSGIPSSDIVQSNSQCIGRTNSGFATLQDSESYKTSLGNNTEIESNINEPMIPNQNDTSDSDDQCWDRRSRTSIPDDHHGKQDWSKVQTHAWTLLLTIAIKSFIEGIAFVLTLQDSFSAGLAFLVTMIFKLFPLEPGYAIILSDAGLNHYWETTLSTLAVLPIYLGKLVFS